MIHAEDDYDIPWHHTRLLFWHGVNATGVSHKDFEEKVSASKKDLGAAGSITDWRTEHGLIRAEILKTGLYKFWLYISKTNKIAYIIVIPSSWPASTLYSLSV